MKDNLPHGHIFNTHALPALSQGDILLHGHTHITAWEAFGNGNMCILSTGIFCKKLTGGVYHYERL